MTDSKPVSNAGISSPPMTSVTLEQIMAAIERLSIRVVTPHQLMTATGGHQGTVVPPLTLPTVQTVSVNDYSSEITLATAPPELVRDILDNIEVTSEDSPAAPTVNAAAEAPTAEATPAAIVGPLIVTKTCKIPGGIPVDPTTVFDFGNDDDDVEEAPLELPAGSIVGVATSGGYHCGKCGQHNVVKAEALGDGPFYMVAAGYMKVGIFKGWHRAQPCVTGVPHANVQKFMNRKKAVDAFNAALAEGNVVILTIKNH